MATPLALRHTYPRDARCPSCWTGLSDQRRAVIVHQDPRNPDGPYIHPVHKNCLLQGYRINQLANCYICHGLLDMQRFIPAGLRLPEVVALRPDDTSMIDQIGRATFNLVIPSALEMSRLMEELISTTQNNQTNIQELDSGSWYGGTMSTAMFTGVVSVCVPASIMLAERNERLNIFRDLSMGGIALCSAIGEVHPDRMVTAAIPVLLLLGSQLVAFEAARDASRIMLKQLKQIIAFLKKEIAIGVPIGLAARMIPSAEKEQVQRMSALVIVIGSMMVMGIVKGIWRGAHPNRN